MFPFWKCQPKYTSCLSFIGSACSFCTHVSWCCHVLSLSSLYNMTDCFSFTIKSQPTSSIFILFHPSFFSTPNQSDPLVGRYAIKQRASSPPRLICILLGVFASVLRKLFCLTYTYRADTQREGRAWADRKERNP